MVGGAPPQLRQSKHNRGRACASRAHPPTHHLGRVRHRGRGGREREKRRNKREVWRVCSTRTRAPPLSLSPLPSLSLTCTKERTKAMVVPPPSTDETVLIATSVKDPFVAVAELAVETVRERRGGKEKADRLLNRGSAVPAPRHGRQRAGLSNMAPAAQAISSPRPPPPSHNAHKKSYPSPLFSRPAPRLPSPTPSRPPSARASTPASSPPCCPTCPP